MNRAHATWSLLLLPPLLLASSCTETQRLPGRVGRVRLLVHTSPYDTPWEDVAVLRLTLVLAAESLSLEFDPGSGEVEIPGSAAYESARLLLEGLDIAGSVVAAGRSAYFTTSPDQVTDVDILFASTGRLVRLADDLLVPRFGHRLAELEDGRLLVVGGAAGGTLEQPDELATAEIYDPLSGGGCLAGEAGCLAEQPGLRRIFHNLGGAAGGNLLLFGGLDQGGAVAESILLFDPTLGEFREFTNYDPQHIEPGWHHTQLLLARDDGRPQLLLAGGLHGEPGAVTPSNRVLVFDLAAETFTRSALELSPARAELCAVALGEGRALLAGGNTELGPSDRLEQFDGTQVVDWTDAGGTLALQRARAGAQCARLGDGRVLVLGGRDSFGASVDTVELFDPDSLELQQVELAGLDEPGRELAVLLDDERGRLLLAGGRRSDGFSVRTLDEFYLIDTGAESGPRVDTAGRLPWALAGAAGIRLTSGALLLAGGYCPDCDTGSARAEVWYFQP